MVSKWVFSLGSIQKKLWIVCPPMVRAATAVGARKTALRGRISVLRYWRKVDFPVPARPEIQMKRSFSSSIRARAVFISSVRIIESKSASQDPYGQRWKGVTML